MTQISEAKTLKEIIKKNKDLDGALMPILVEIQEKLGYVPKESLPTIAEELNLSRAEVYGVFSFYHDFKDKKVEAIHLKICMAEACQANGCRRLAEHLEKEYNIRVGDSKDGYTIEEVFCLGNCACGPSVMTSDQRVHAFVDTDKLDNFLNPNH